MTTSGPEHRAAPFSSLALSVSPASSRSAPAGSNGNGSGSRVNGHGHGLSDGEKDHSSSSFARSAQQLMSNPIGALRTALSSPRGRPASMLRARVLLAVVAVVLLLVLWRPSSLAQCAPGDSQCLTQSAPLVVARTNDYAYVTLLCDDVMLDPVLVLAASLRSANTSHPFIVLTLANLSATARHELTHPNSGVTELRSVAQLPYPFKVGAAGMTMNKPCRYSKLHLWNMTEFSKVVYLDADVMLLNNVDELFQQPELSAVPDLAGVVNTGVLVAEPSAVTFADMIAQYPSAPSYNHGDQGFLNWYFGEHLSNKMHPLPVEFNLVSRYQEYAIYDTIREKGRIMHFTSETKPWTFYYTPHPHWQRNIDGQLFFRWMRHLYEVQHTIRGKAKGELTGLALQAFNFTNDPDWPFRAHVDHLASTAFICADRWKHKLKTDKFSVVIGTFGSDERLELLKLIITHFRNSSLVDRIYLTWHNPASSPPAHLTRLFTPTDKAVAQVVLLPQTTDSLNNRFNPIPGLRTRCVYIADDDVRIPIEDIETGFRSWQANQQRMVGFFPRSHVQTGPDTYEYVLHTFGRVPGYSIVLTKGFFTDSFFLHTYTCLLPPVMHAYVNMLNNCEDILFQMMASGMTGQPPLAVYTLVDEFGAYSGISSGKGHINIRGVCIADLVQLFGGRMPLVYSDQLVHRYPVKSGVPYRKKNLTQW